MAKFGIKGGGAPKGNKNAAGPHLGHGRVVTAMLNHKGKLALGVLGAGSAGAIMLKAHNDNAAMDIATSATQSDAIQYKRFSDAVDTRDAQARAASVQRAANQRQREADAASNTKMLKEDLMKRFRIAGR